MIEPGRHRVTAVLALCATVLLVGCPSADPNAPGSTDSLLSEAGQSRVAAASVLLLPPEDCGTPQLASELASQVIARINQIRVREGLPALTVNETLTQVAEGYACQHVEDHFYELLGGEDGDGLSHCHPLTCGLGPGLEQGPGERAIAAGYVFRIIGENLAGGQRTPDEVVADWMASPGHRDNILAPHWTETGVGVRTGGHFGIYWVQMFGLPF